MTRSERRREFACACVAPLSARIKFCNRLDAALRASISKNHHGIASRMSVLCTYARICMNCATVYIDLFNAKRQRYLYLLFAKRNSASIRF